MEKGLVSSRWIIIGDGLRVREMTELGSPAGLRSESGHAWKDSAKMKLLRR